MTSISRKTNRPSHKEKTMATTRNLITAARNLDPDQLQSLRAKRESLTLTASQARDTLDRMDDWPEEQWDPVVYFSALSDMDAATTGIRRLDQYLGR